MSCGCSKRLPYLLRFFGFTPASEGGWFRRTDRGRVVLNLDPEHYTRGAILAFLVWLFQ
jgi:predicted cupin superfamily sugar epimerase